MKAVAVCTIFLVEDNRGDAFLFKEAVKASGVPATLHVAGDGKEALAFLQRQAPFVDAPRPDVVVLDLNLPVMNGQEMLVEMMSQPAFLSIPVAILTTSASEQCVCNICQPGQCLYFVKTADFTELQTIVRQIAAHASKG